MAYQVLARKYRPQRFSDVAGQDHVTRTLLNGLGQGRIAHGYIFSGHRGIGKTTIARILAMALNCRTEIGSELRPTPEPCGVCESCTEVRAGNAVDVIEIDAATNRGIDEIRELRDAARYRPARDRYKIYILDEAHQITDAAFNALLKTLEEPPDHVVFMMATTQPEDIPQTIRSRCQHFSFHAVKFADILTQLRTIAAAEEITAGEEALALLAEAGDGSMRDALSIMDQAIASAPGAVMEGISGGQAQPQLDPAQIRELMGSVPNTVFERLMEAIGENQSGPVIEEINRLLNAGNSASKLARQFVRYLRNALMARIAGEQTELLQLSPDERARAARSALLFSEEDLTRFLGVMLRTFDELNYRQEPRFHLELGLLKLVHLQRLLPVEQLLSQLGAGPPKLGGGPLPGSTARKPDGGGARGLASTIAPASELQRPAAYLVAPPVEIPDSAEMLPQRHSSEPMSTSAAVRPDSAPAFSPFEQDSQRKEPEPRQQSARLRAAESNGGHPAGNTRVPAAPTRLPAQAAAGAAPQEPATVDNAPVLAPIAALSITEPEAAVPGAEAVAPMLAPAGFHGAGRDDMSETQGAATLDAVRERVCAALVQAGHSTAGALLGSGEWKEAAGTIEVQVAAKKVMLGLTMNADAEKICREVMRAMAGGAKPRSLTFVPGNGSVEPAPRQAVLAASGSVEARARENPLVRQAQELFGAEVRSVVDLRNK